MLNPRLYKPIGITCGLMFFQRFSGANAFTYYAVNIFRRTLGGMNPHGATIAIGCVQLLASLLSGMREFSTFPPCFFFPIYNFPNELRRGNACLLTWLEHVSSLAVWKMYDEVIVLNHSAAVTKSL